MSKRHAGGKNRKHIRIWVDAAGASRHIAMVASYDAQTVSCLCKSPDEWWSILADRGDSQIGNQEMLSICLALESLGSTCEGAVVILFCDNAGVLHSMMRGSSRCVETNQMIGRTWYEAMRKRIGLHLLKVQSKANIADLPSRQDFALLKLMGAKEIEPRLPSWLGSLWEVPEYVPAA